MACHRKLQLVWVAAEHLEPATEKGSPGEYHKAWHQICTAQGILVPGGFGTRGTEGMIATAKYARTTSKPYLGICLGMQIAVIEYARNICGILDATSMEVCEKRLNPVVANPVVTHMPEIDRTTMGATMRLGLRPTLFQEHSEWSKLRALYSNEAVSLKSNITEPNGITSSPQSPSKQSTANGPVAELSSTTSPLVIQERHRHRYEVNPDYIDTLTSHGMTFIGKDDKGERMEIMELKDHPWYVGVQYHPEYLSRVLRPSKPYLGFVAAASECLDEIITRGKGSAETGLTNGLHGDEI